MYFFDLSLELGLREVGNVMFICTALNDVHAQCVRQILIPTSHTHTHTSVKLSI